MLQIDRPCRYDRHQPCEPGKCYGYVCNNEKYVILGHCFADLRQQVDLVGVRFGSKADIELTRREHCSYDNGDHLSDVDIDLRLWHQVDAAALA